MKGKEGSNALSYQWQDRSNMALSLNTDALRIFESLGSEFRTDASRARAWSNIFILNELRRLFPDKDPQAIYETFWKASLATAETGTYTWNDEWQTMESSLWGHPGQQKNPSMAVGVLEKIKRADLALTFENGGLRVRAGYERWADSP
jgi:hypothetical protein